VAIGSVMHMNAPAGTTRRELPGARTADPTESAKTEPSDPALAETAEILASTERATAYATAAATLLAKAERAVR
jgi:hypothetical protein